MKYSTVGLTLILLFFVGAQPANALPFESVDARSLGSGGTGVASAGFASAAFFNPALLADAKKSDDFSLNLPVGISAADEDELVDSVNDFIDSNVYDDFNDSLDSISSNVDGLSNNFSSINTAIDSSDPNALRTANQALGTDLQQLDTDTDSLVVNTSALNNSLRGLSDKALRAVGGAGPSLALPGTKFAAALSLNGYAVVTGKLQISDNDLGLISSSAAGIDAYVDAANDYQQAVGNAITALDAVEDVNNNPGNYTPAEQAAIAQAATDAEAAVDAAQANIDTFSYGGSATPNDASDGDVVVFQNGELALDDPQLQSTASLAAAAVGELGISLARKFNLGGQDFTLGLTPKLQRIVVYDLVYSLSEEDDLELDDITDSERSYSDFNLDLGILKRFGEKRNWVVGLVAKNLIANDYETASGNIVSLNTQARAGFGFESKWFSLAADVDLTENDPAVFGNPTQYFSIGGEVDLLWDTFQLRGGYRNNMAADEEGIISLGFGFSPWVLKTDFGLYANPDATQFGAALQVGIDF